MNELNKIVAENLVELRKKAGLTQQELANQLSYSDKTVSKWELGQAIPSVEVLKGLADYYGVTLDYLVSENEKKAEISAKKAKTKMNNNLVIVLLINSVILLIATVIFVWTIIASNNGQTIDQKPVNPYWQVFVWSVSSCFFISFLLVRKLWRHEKIPQIILSSFFVWTLITAFYLQFISQNVWYIYFVGIPIQIVIVLLFSMKRNN